MTFPHSFLLSQLNQQQNSQNKTILTQMFICESFLKQENDDADLLPCPTSSKRSNSHKKKEVKNRFANLGLDKFYALMSELDEKKQKIYTQKGAEDITLVRFVITKDNEIKPIVVKVKDKRQSHAKEKISISQNLEVSLKVRNEKAHENDQKVKRCINFDFGFGLKLKRFKQPVYYLPVFVMLVLLFLAIYGKSFAILCTSILWYLIPVISGGKSSENGSRKAKRPRKKEFTRRYSEKIIVRSNQSENDGQLFSPTSIINGATDTLPGKKHGHRKSF